MSVVEMPDLAAPSAAALHPALIADPAAHAYPRPQLEREGWTSLNGRWQFALDRDGEWRRPEAVQWGDASIVVPFAPETPAGGVHETGFFQAAWYRRAFAAPALAPGERLLLHFGAVDYEATVWVNRSRLGSHEGGYLPFTLDVTDALLGDGRDGLLQELVVLAQDDPHDVAKPRGKQDWQLKPHSIWYPRTSGIWQTVWLEVVPATRIGALRWTSSLERWEIGVDLTVAGLRRDGLRARVRLSVGGTIIADDTYQVVAGEVHRRIALSDPGSTTTATSCSGARAAPRSSRPRSSCGPDAGSGSTRCAATRRSGRWGRRATASCSTAAPTRCAWCSTRATGRTPASPPRRTRRSGSTWSSRSRWGSTASASTRRSRTRATCTGPTGSASRLGRDAERVPVHLAERAAAHPSVAGRRRARHQPPVRGGVGPIQRELGGARPPDDARAAALRAGALPPHAHARPEPPVIGNDGWESVATDIVAIHDYDHKPDRIAKRYHGGDELPRILEKERPGGRRLVVAGHTEHSNLPVMLTEFGGIAYHPDPTRTWGYSRTETVEELLARYEALLAAVNDVSLFAGFCYTQFTTPTRKRTGCSR
jgi:hypothetical protein